ncbi:IS6 family transposase [Streptomyces sp. NPDC048411]|uniref:IS6 family transposase n=1 Tax=Streptomyces sp. NPDC048411 TaxID=3157206 RepID=UPI0034529E40
MNPAPPYKGHRYPVEVISHCVWLYFRFPLSYREVEELMLQRGVIVSCETVRRWCAKFGQAYADGLRRRRPRPGDKWHLDEVFIKINGKRQYLWRAVDQDGTVLDILVQSKRDAKAAKRFMAKLMKKQCRVPRVLVTVQSGIVHRRPAHPIPPLVPSRHDPHPPRGLTKEIGAPPTCWTHLPVRSRRLPRTPAPKTGESVSRWTWRRVP